MIFYTSKTSHAQRHPYRQRGKEAMSDITTGVQIILPQHCNGYQRPRLFGGQLMAWIDIIGAVAARRFTKSTVTTVCVDNLNFIGPAYLNDTVVQEARVTWAGRTSLEVRVDSYVEQLDGSRTLVNRAYAVYVALDENDQPQAVPEFVPETEEEKQEYVAAVMRRKARLARA